jgi:hypothetical protein
MSRTSYRDPSLAGQPVRSGDSTHGESNLDVEYYLQPLEQVHGSGLHDWGVAHGLRTTATIGAAGVTVEPGIAVDAGGRHISLAGGTVLDPSHAETATVDPPVPSVPALVTGAGVTVPTVKTPPYPPGDYYVIARWLEVFDQAAVGSPTGAVWRFNLMPWLRLLPVTGFVDNGEQVVLARVHLDGVGNVTSLSHELRRVVGVPVQGVRLRGAATSTTAGKTASAEADGAELRVRRDATGTPAGAELVTARPTDEIHLKARGPAGADTAAAKIQLSAGTVTARNAAGTDTVTVATTTGDVTAGGTVTAGRVVARRSDGKESVVIDSQLGNVTAGTAGVEGDVLVKDAGGNLVITLDGQRADVVVGGQGNSGNLRLWDSQRVEQVNIDGAVGDVWYRNNLRDPALPAHPGITHTQLRTLVGGFYTGLHRHLNTGNAAFARGVWMFANNSTAIQTISFGSSRRMVATIYLTAMDPEAGFDRGDGFFAEIYRVNGNDFRQQWFFDGDHLGTDGADANMRRPFFSGFASSITFRLRSVQDANVWALALVFPEDG